MEAEGKEGKGTPLFVYEGKGGDKKEFYFPSKSFLLWRALDVNKMKGLDPSKSSPSLFAIQTRGCPSLQILSFLFPPSKQSLNTNIIPYYI